MENQDIIGQNRDASSDSSNEDIQFHKHCQKTVLPAHGTDNSIGATWQTIQNLLDNNELSNLDPSWIERFQENPSSITDDLAAILKIINDNYHECQCDCNLLPVQNTSNGFQIQRNVNVYKMSVSTSLTPTVDLTNYKKNNLDIVSFEYHITNNGTSTIQVNTPSIIGIDNPSSWKISCFTDDDKIEPEVTSVFVFRADMKNKLLEYGLAYKKEK